MAGKPASRTVNARLFDADQPDRKVELTAKTATGLRDRQLLWVDALRGDAPDDDRALLSLLGFEPDVVLPVWESPAKPRLVLHADSFVLRMVAVVASRGRDRPVSLDLVVGHNIVLTAHAEPIDVLAHVDARIQRDTALGSIVSTEFATVILDALVTAYLELVDEIEASIDDLDRQALKPSAARDLLGDLVTVRHRIAAIRRTLVSHREVFAAMAGADFQAITGTDAAPRFVALTARFDRAIDAMDTAREALLGTFDIHMTRTAQRTNDIVKILTIVSVLLLPTGVIAGFMGMNIKAPYSNDDPTIFWFVVAGIATLALLTVLGLRARRWL